MYTNFSRAMVKISLAAVILLSASVAASQVLFSDDFESGLGQWVGKTSPTSHSGQIVSDPLDAGNHVLNFTALGSAGDIFSSEVTIAEDTTYTLVFDYLGDPTQGGVVNDLGGTIGFAEDTPGDHRWLAGTRADGGIEEDLLDDDGLWHTYSIEFNSSDAGCCGYGPWSTNPPSNETIRVMLEDFVGSGGVTQDAYFDNISLLGPNTRYVPPSEDPITFFDGAIDPHSPHGISAGYQEVLEGGTVTIDCCRVVDWREGAGSGKKYGPYLPTDFDIGVAIDLAAQGTDPNCQDLQVYGGMFGAGKAKLHPWQRAVPADPEAADRTGTEFGVCLVRSEVISRGVLFTEENTINVLGYSVDCTREEIDDRPYTSGVAVIPTDINSPYAIRESADCDGSRSGKRSSDRLVVLNEWHYTKHKATQPYLSQFAASLLQLIDDERTRMPACVDNSGGYLDDLTALVQTAKQEMQKKGNPGNAEAALNNATRLALLIPTDPPSDPVMPPDPYFSSTPFCLANNAQGLFTGRLMALKFANCSENLHPDDSSSSSDVPAACEIEPDIYAELPTLPE